MNHVQLSRLASFCHHSAGEPEMLDHVIRNAICVLLVVHLPEHTALHKQEEALFLWRRPRGFSRAESDRSHYKMSPNSGCSVRKEWKFSSATPTCFQSGVSQHVPASTISSCFSSLSLSLWTSSAPPTSHF